MDSTERREQTSRKSNDEVINELMVYGNPLKQLIIMEAVRRYTEAVISLGREGYRAQAGEGAFLNPDAWFNCCLEIKRVMDAHLEAGKR